MKIKHLILPSTLLVLIIAFLTSCTMGGLFGDVANMVAKQHNMPDDLDGYVEQVTSQDDFKENEELIFGENNNAVLSAEHDYFVVSYTLEEDMYKEYERIAEYCDCDVNEYLTTILTDYTYEEDKEDIRAFKEMLEDGKLEVLNDNGADIDLDGVIVEYYSPDGVLICKRTVDF